MRNAHIAFVSFPHPPSVNPTLPVVAVLVKRGHRVTYVSSDRFSSRLAAIGAEFVRCPPYEFHFSANGQWNSNSICELATTTLGEIAPFYKANRPDIVIYHSIAFAGRILASKRNIPAIQTSANFAFQEHVLDQQLRDPALRKIAHFLSSKANEFLRHYGIATEDFLFHREKLNIYMFPKDLEPYVDSADAHCFYAGRCAGEQLPFGSWRNTNGLEKPIALVATSTTTVQGSDHFRMCVEALSALGWHVVLSIGDNADPHSYLPLPEEFEIVQNTSHTRILPHASILIYMGGIITSAEAAYHGVPLLVTSCGSLELEGLGDNIARKKLGTHLRKSDMNAESVRQAALGVIGDASILNNVKELQRRVRQEPGAEETANKIEEFIAKYCT